MMKKQLLAASLAALMLAGCGKTASKATEATAEPETTAAETVIETVEETTAVTEEVRDLLAEAKMAYSSTGPNYEMARQLLLELNDSENAEANYLLGMTYYAEDDNDSAKPYLEKAAEQGYVPAKLPLGLIALLNEENANYAQLQADFKEVTEAGDVAGQAGLAVMNQLGKGVPASGQKALELFSEAAGSEDRYWERFAYTGIASIYSGSAEDVQPDSKKAFDYSVKAAELGSSEAMCTIGYCYYAGEGVEQSYELAMEWYERAAAAGNRWAMWLIGGMYENGHGVEMDADKAAEYYAKAEAGEK